MTIKFQMCTICMTDDYDLIRNCELRGRFQECSATALLLVDPYRIPQRLPRAPKQETTP